MRAAVIEDGMVVNVIEVEGEDPGWVLCPDGVNIGWSHDGSNWTPPPEPVPPPVEGQQEPPP